MLYNEYLAGTSGAASPWPGRGRLRSRCRPPTSPAVRERRAVRSGAATPALVRDDRRPARAYVARPPLLLAGLSTNFAAMIGLSAPTRRTARRRPPAPITPPAGAPSAGAPVRPHLMKLPAGANAANCHGLVTDSAANIYLRTRTTAARPTPTAWCGGSEARRRVDDGRRDGAATARRSCSSSSPRAAPSTCTTRTTKLKTTLDGTVVWQRNGYFGQDPQSKYRRRGGAAARLDARVPVRWIRF